MSRAISVLILVAIVLSSLVQTSSPSYFSRVVTVEYSHSHSHSHGTEDHHHHHHDDQDPEASDAPEGNQASTEEHSGETHKHSILVVSGVAVALPVSVLMTYNFEPVRTTHFAIEVDPPADRALGSIFRPPIAA